MAALDLGFLLRGAGRALTGYRQGTREREEMERARQVEDAERMFKEWATKQQMEREQRRDAATVDYQNRTLAQQAARDAAAEASRKRDDERLTEEAVARRLGEGYETAIPETAQTAANAALSGLGMGQFGVVRARKSDPRIAEAGGVKFRPEETGDVQYITTGGRMMRRDPQRAANAAAQEKADELAAELRLARERMQMSGSQALRHVPPHIVTGYQNNLKQLGIVQEALNAITAHPDAVGLKGYIPDVILNRMDPKGSGARMAIADLGSLEIRDRSGAAVTAAEFPRLAPFIPNDTDDPKTVVAKLNRFYRILQEETEMLRSSFGPDMGYRGFSPSLQPPNTEASLSDADLWEKKVQEGMSKDEATRYVRNRRRQ